MILLGLDVKNVQKSHFDVELGRTIPPDSSSSNPHTPVSSWRYKDGQGDGGAHVGPMAQNVRKTMGETAAPDGKQIDLISMNGISMAAIAALDKKVGRLERRVGKTDLHR